MCFGDVLIIKDEDEPRNKWQLARVTETFQSADGYVRKVNVAVADRELDNSGKKVKPIKFLERPIQKLVLLQETETWFIPDEEPYTNVAMNFELLFVSEMIISGEPCNGIVRPLPGHLI